MGRNGYKIRELWITTDNAEHARRSDAELHQAILDSATECKNCHGEGRLYSWRSLSNEVSCRCEECQGTGNRPEQPARETIPFDPWHHT